MNNKSLFTVLLLLAIVPALSQTDTGKTTFVKMLKIENNIYMLQGDGGNIGLSIGPDGLFMVDNHFTDDVEQMQMEIKKISDKPVRFVLNTHFHHDHTGGNSLLAREGAIIISQDEVRPRLEKVMKQGSRKMSEAILPVITFNDDLTLYFNNEKIYIFHVPNAHTDGDAMVYFSGSNVLHTGDVFVNGQYPFIDLEHGGSLNGYAAGIQKALSIINPKTKIISGHGPAATYKDLTDSYKLLGSTFKKISQLAHLGKTEDEVASMEELREVFQANGYSDGFITAESFIRTIYKEATQGKNDRVKRVEENEKARQKYEEIKKQQQSKNRGKN